MTLLKLFNPTINSFLEIKPFSFVMHVPSRLLTILSILEKTSPFVSFILSHLEIISSSMLIFAYHLDLICFIGLALEAFTLFSVFQRVNQPFEQK